MKTNADDLSIVGIIVLGIRDDNGSDFDILGSYARSRQSAGTPFGMHSRKQYLCYIHIFDSPLAEQVPYDCLDFFFF